MLTHVSTKDIVTGKACLIIYLFLGKDLFYCLHNFNFCLGGACLLKRKIHLSPSCHEIKLQYMTVKVIKMMMQDYSANSQVYKVAG